MKKLRLRIVSLFLCFLMVLTTFVQIPMTANATEAIPEIVSAEETTDTVSENTALTEETAGTEQTGTNDSPVSYEASLETETTETSDISNQPAESSIITASFYDSDGTTLLMSFPMPYNGDSETLGVYASISQLSPVRRGYAIYKWNCVTNGKEYRPAYVTTSLKIKRDLMFTAIWDEDPYDFEIDYQLNGGSFSSMLEDIPDTFNVTSETIPLPAPQRAGYMFDGWFLDAAYTTPVTAIPAGTYIDSDENGDVSCYTVYAKWTSCTPGNAAKPTAQNTAKGKIKVSFQPAENAGGYEITYASSKNFKKDKVTKDLGLKTVMTLTNLPAKKTYYFKVRAYVIDSTGQRCYGNYSPVCSCKVKKGVKEVTAKANSGKLKKVNIRNGNELYVTATVAKRLKSSDGCYYLVKVDPNNGKVLKQIAKTDKSKSVVFRLPLREDDGTNHIQGKFGVAVKKGKKYMLITSTSFINNPEDAASYTAPFPTPTSKKGRQGLYNSDLGDKNYFINFNLNTIIGSKNNYSVAYKYNGKTYYFLNPNFGNLSVINEDGGTVTVQLMLQYSSNAKDLILPSARSNSSAHYYAFNTETKAAREKLEAAFQFITEYASKKDYHVDNWILGNEVNTFANMNAKWYYAGNISRDKFMKNYASTYRMLYYAVKSNNKNGRAYICCDHTWINRENDWGTKYFTSAFDKEIKKQNKNIGWNLAYHAYSAVLTNADFWNDGSLAPNNQSADFVSPKNLEILTNYVKKNFGTDTRIILSEQGFSCSGGVGSPYNNGRQSGEAVQAAAVAYLYYKAQFNNMIDAVIFSSGDHGGAGYQFDFIGREAEKVYKYMDTPKYETYVNPYVKQIGASSWKSIVQGFSDDKLKSMPSR